jgi:ATP-dependent DNA ligase
VDAGLDVADFVAHVVDMEAIVAKQASAKYTPETTTWVKIKDRQYSQAVGREDFSTAEDFKRR